MKRYRVTWESRFGVGWLPEHQEWEDRGCAISHFKKLREEEQVYHNIQRVHLYEQDVSEWRELVDPIPLSLMEPGRIYWVGSDGSTQEVKGE